MRGLRIGLMMVVLFALSASVSVVRACPLCASGNDDSDGNSRFGLSETGQAAALAPWALGGAVAGGGFLALRARNGRRGRRGRM